MTTVLTTKIEGGLIHVFCYEFSTCFVYEMKALFSLSTRHVVLDTPGQIEVFTWSASGSIITESLVCFCHTSVPLSAKLWPSTSQDADKCHLCRWKQTKSMNSSDSVKFIIIHMFFFFLFR